jgi:ubiquinol-cytochrome c reductase cytochrome c1 subunit
MQRIAYRNLTEIGFTEDEAKAFAATATIPDVPNAKGEVLDRQRRLSDPFPTPFPNAEAARAANNGALPPDLSLIVKARHGGPDYVYALLTGYGKVPPVETVIGEGRYYNPYFPGGQLSMPAPLSDGQVTYTDGTVSTVPQMARDVVQFLQWAAEPEMEARKRLGIKTLAFLAMLTIALYAAKCRIWHKAQEDKV